jgi:hypothetical protein
VGNGELMRFQVSREEIPYCQVGKGKEVRLSESLRNSEVSSDQKRVMIDEDSCGFTYHVKEDDEKLNTPIAEEEDQRCILIIGGIEIFLPSNPAKARACVAYVMIEETNPTVTVKGEEKE